MTAPAWPGPLERARLASFLSTGLADWKGQTADGLHLERLPGGSVQESWRVSGQGGSLVLRASGLTRLPASHSREREFALLEAAHGAGVLCPRPLLLEPTGEVIGRPFFLMTHEAGTTDPDAITTVDDAGGARLARSLGRELGRLHRIRPPRDDLGFLPPATANALAALAEYRGWMDDLAGPHPVLEWAWRRLARVVPPAGPTVLCHRDFRTGNYLVEGDRLVAILDWEFAGWGDPAEDLGWFCARSWRFDRPDRPAGGIAPLTDMLHAYEAETGLAIAPSALGWWEAAASLRWALIAVQQRDRMLVSGERSLDLAMTGRRVVACEAELLRLLGSA